MFSISASIWERAKGMKIMNLFYDSRLVFYVWIFYCFCREMYSRIVLRLNEIMFHGGLGDHIVEVCESIFRFFSFHSAVKLSIEMKRSLRKEIPKRVILRYIFGYSTEKKSQIDHKILIIGDGFASGIGEWITIGQRSGLDRRLRYLIDKELLFSGNNKVSVGSLRTRWDIVSKGKARSNSYDWIPGENIANYFDDIFGSQKNTISDIDISMKGKTKLVETQNLNSDNTTEGNIGIDSLKHADVVIVAVGVFDIIEYEKCVSYNAIGSDKLSKKDFEAYRKFHEKIKRNREGENEYDYKNYKSKQSTLHMKHKIQTEKDGYIKEELVPVVNNLMKIILNLATKQHCQKILVCDIPSWIPQLCDEYRFLIEEINEQLQHQIIKFIQEQEVVHGKDSTFATNSFHPKKGSKTPPLDIKLVHLDDPRFHRKYVKDYRYEKKEASQKSLNNCSDSEFSPNLAFDRVHLNRRGYDIFGENVLEKLKYMMINVEWCLWKSMFNNNVSADPETTSNVVSVESKQDAATCPNSTKRKLKNSGKITVRKLQDKEISEKDSDSEEDERRNDSGEEEDYLKVHDINSGDILGNLNEAMEIFRSKAYKNIRDSEQ